MELETYFESTRGTGILATADTSGKVDAAIYGRPHHVAGETIAVLMADRLTHRNLQSNPNAIYLFIEEGGGYKGCRLVLTKVREETDAAKIQALRRRKLPEGCDVESARCLVYFRVTEVRPLVGEEVAADRNA